MTESFSIPDSPIALTGKIVLWVGYLIAAYAAAAGLAGNARKNRRLVDSAVNSLYAFFALMMIASALIIYAFVTHDYTIKYVWAYSDTSMPLGYKITAYWGGLDGSLMFWVSVLSLFSAIAIWTNHRRHREMIGYVVATIMVVQLFFLSLLIYTKNPFNTFLTDVPPDGKGLNPLLQNYWMVIHPPSLYTGFVAATIPFAFGIGAMASGHTDDRWIASVRTWTLISWFFLSLGLILGGRWAYEELGWGGYWAWDPVENAGLIPWFTATAFLHSVIIQEQRGMMKVWNLVLVVSTFFFTVFGTFMTRSGVVQSVHAFGEDNELALLFILFMALILVISFGLLIFRMPRLRAQGHFESFWSREFAFLMNNWVLLGCAVFVLFATMFPTLSEAINGVRITVGPAFFNKWMTPLGLILLFLAGAAPLLAYRRTTRQRLVEQFMVPGIVGTATILALAVLVPASRARTPIFADFIRLPVSLVNFGLIAFTLTSVFQEFFKGTRVRMKQTGGDPVTSFAGLLLNRRRKYGGYIIHMAIGVMFFGIAGQTWERMEDFTVSRPGETFDLGDYTFRFEEFHQYSDDYIKKGSVAKVTVLEDGDEIDVLSPEVRKYRKGEGQATTEVALARPIWQHLDEDIYVVLTGFEEVPNSGPTPQIQVNLRVFINPLINWLWLGFGFLILGTALCLFPQKWVDGLSPRRRSRTGRAAEVAVLLLVFGGAGVGLARVAHAAAPPRQQALEHQDTEVGAAAHESDKSYAGVCRPNSPTAGKLMKELVCLCGGCKRESLYDCKCQVAADERCHVLELLAGRDLSSESARQSAYDAVEKAYVDEYGEQVKATPKSNVSWAVPAIAIGGGLIIVFFLVRAWVRRGRAAVAERVKVETPTEDEEIADKLDDELSDID
ncbi:MAG TPA: cytochrome c-type biogenesis CcmF C-terminal domain-containing protein [Kofleriaceae bacterium]|nr:cytochrome c-type biogenesis CcmF C-terminal domain-containing protein [Kofleriaceae bacterium]